MKMQEDLAEAKADETGPREVKLVAELAEGEEAEVEVVAGAVVPKTDDSAAARKRRVVRRKMVETPEEE
jgi:hypothetical protein